MVGLIFVSPSERACMVQAQYSQSHPSRQQLQRCLDAFQGQSLGSIDVADSQRRSVLTAQAMHFLQPQDVQVGFIKAC